MRKKGKKNKRKRKIRKRRMGSKRKIL